MLGLVRVSEEREGNHHQQCVFLSRSVCSYQRSSHFICPSIHRVGGRHDQLRQISRLPAFPSFDHNRGLLRPVQKGNV